MPQATMEFVDQVVLYIKTIAQEVGHSLFTAVGCMSNVIRLSGGGVQTKLAIVLLSLIDWLV